MQTINGVGSFDAILDEKYGKIGILGGGHEEFHCEGYAYCIDDSSR